MYEQRRKDMDAAMDEYETLMGIEALRIHRAAEQCLQEGESEAEWNMQVHNRLLGLVLEHPTLRGKLTHRNM